MSNAQKSCTRAEGHNQTEEFGGSEGFNDATRLRGTVEKGRQRRSRCAETSTYNLYASASLLPAALLDVHFEQSLRHLPP